MRFPILLITLTIAGTLVTVPPQSHAQTPAQNNAAKALFLEGQAFWDQGRFVDAEKKFREALAKYPRAENSDKTSFYLVTTLVKLERPHEAVPLVQSFNRNYPQSSWSNDIAEMRVKLGVAGAPFGAVYRFHPATPVRVPMPMPPQPLPPGSYTISITANADQNLAQEVFRVIVRTDANYAIHVARERLKANPSDPAVVSNFGLIAGSGSPQAFPFFVSVASDGPIPNTQTQALFWMGRLNNAEDAVGKAFIALTAERTLPVVVDVLNQLKPIERSNVLKQVVQHPSPEKVVAIERVFKTTNVQPFRSQIVESAATIPESAALEFITDVARNEREQAVRITAIHALGTRKDVDVKVLGDIMKTLPPPPPPPALQLRMKKDERSRTSN